MKGKLFKRVAAMALALAMVGTAVPQGSGFAGLFCGSDITASADEEGDFSYTQLLEDTCKITRYNGQSTNLEIPETLGGLTVTGIGDNAFSNNKNLEHIVLPETLVTIGSCAFANCYALEEIILPDSVTSIDHSAFDQCHGLKSIKFSSNLHELKYDTFNNTGVTNLTIPNSVKQIGGERVFANCANLKTLVIEGSPYIGVDAFYYCQALETVVLEPGVATIDNCAFQGCSSLKTVTIPNSVHMIGEKAFDNTGDDLTLIFEGSKADWDTPAYSRVWSNMPDSVKCVYSDDIGIRLYGHSLSLLEDNNIGVNFYIQLPEGLSEKARMHVTIPTGSTVKEEDIYVSDADERTVDEKTYKVFKCAVAAKEMTSRITAQIIDEQNELVGPVYVYSVKEYADYLLGHQSVDAYAKAAPLVKAMLNYGAYSQIYFNQNTSDLANTGLTEADKDVSGVTAAQINKPYTTAYDQTVEKGEAISFDLVALSLKSNTELVLYFSCKDKLKIEGEDPNVSISGSGNKQVVRISGIRPDKLGDDYSVMVSNSEGGTQYVKYCPLSYCYYVVLEERGTEELQNVCKALFLYYQAAVDYFKV